MKKTLSLILSIIMLITVICAMPLSAFAGDMLTPSSGECGDAAYYSLDSDGTLTISGNGSFGGFSNSYNGYDNIKSVIIGNSISEIESSAFDGCSNLKSVTI